MNVNEFREFGKATVDFIADYLENIRDRNVLPSVNPGYLKDLVPNTIPESSENWKVILKDIEKIILPGITHWQSPNFHAYYPTATSFPSIIGEMLSAGFGIVGFSWICSPACTELEAIVMDWVAKYLNLPKIFLNSSDSLGGGVIQGSASEAVLVALLAAREQTVKRIREENPEISEGDIRAKLIAYSSDQSNSCVEKDGMLAALPIKLISTDDDLVLRGNALLEAIEKDIKNGKIPVACIATLGTTGTCAYDNIPELAKICNKYKIWLHVDAAYAGAAFALPEFSELLNGLDLVDSINFNLHKFMMVNFDCCAMWLKNVAHVVDNFNINRIYLKHKFEGQSTAAPDYRHWQIPLGRRFRALKVWITLRTIGAEGFRQNVRKHIALAKQFEDYILEDDRFEIVAKRTLGLVCFRLKGDNKLTKSLLERITEKKNIYLIEAKNKNLHFLRFAICGLDPQPKDIDFAWNEISNQADEVLINAISKIQENQCVFGKYNDNKITNDFSKNVSFDGLKKIL